MYGLIIFLKVIFVLFVIILFGIFNILVERLIINRQSSDQKGRFEFKKTVSSFTRDLLKAIHKSERGNFFKDFSLLYFSTVFALVPIVVLPIMGPIVFEDQKIYSEILYSGEALVIFIILTFLRPLYYFLLNASTKGKRFTLSVFRVYQQLLVTELPFVVSLLALFLSFGTFDFHEIARLQSGVIFYKIPALGCFVQPIAFLIVLFVALLKSNTGSYSLLSFWKNNFETVEGEVDVIIKYSIRLFDSCYDVVFAMLITVLFLGGYGPIFNVNEQMMINFMMADYYLLFVQGIIFLGKTMGVLFFINLAKIVVPRHSAQFLITLSWNKLLVISLINLIATAILLKVGIF